MTIYTISIGSGARVASSSVSDAMYNVDWSILPQNKSFKVGFTFLSTTVNITSFTSIPILQVFLGDADTYRISTVGTTYAIFSNTIGLLAPNTLSTTTFLRGDANANNKIFLRTRPNNNVLNVLLFTPTGGTWVDNVGAPVPSYVLVLTFETIDD